MFDKINEVFGNKCRSDRPYRYIHQKSDKQGKKMATAVKESCILLCVRILNPSLLLSHIRTPVITVA
jgi:hypothetical protein